jgi:hypothetical protein
MILHFTCYCWSRDGYELDGMSSIPDSVQTVSGAHSSISPEVKQLGREADHSPPSSIEVKNGGAIPPLPQMSSWHSA